MKRILLMVMLLVGLGAAAVAQTAVSGAQQTQGTAPDGATAKGNPNLIGGVDGSGLAQSLSTNGTGQLNVVCASGCTSAATTTGADAVANNALSSITGATLNPLAVAGWVFNSSTWDRQLGAVHGVNSAGTGIPLQTITAEFDDTASSACTENQFCVPRVDSGRRLYVVAAFNAAAADGSSNNMGYININGGTNGVLGIYNHTFNGSTWDRTRNVTNSTDSTGTGITATGLLAQLDETSKSAVTENQFANLNIDSRHHLYVRTAAFSPINCVVVVSTATTIQAVGGSCAAPGAGLSIYITDIQFGTSAAAGTAADSFPTLKSGTGGTCGAATAVIWQALTTANSTVVVNLTQPIKVAANSEVCWIMTTAGSKTVQIQGFIAP